MGGEGWPRENTPRRVVSKMRLQLRDKTSGRCDGEGFPGRDEKGQGLAREGVFRPRRHKAATPEAKRVSRRWRKEREEGEEKKMRREDEEEELGEKQIDDIGRNFMRRIKYPFAPPLVTAPEFIPPT